MCKHVSLYTIFCIFYLFLTSTSYAVSPGTWTESTETDFKNGKIENASFTSEGIIMLSPQHKVLFSSSEPYIWSLVNDRNGNIYAGSLTNGVIYKIESKDEEAKAFFDSHQIGVHAMVVDSKGSLYAGTSKEGIIYKVTPDGIGSVFYDPPESYIWALAIDKDDNLYAGTGDGGMIIKITPDGNSKVLYDSTEPHILSIILDGEGDVYAGSGNEGRVYKVTQKENRVFCMYDTSEPEVRALALDSKGNIYAATSPTVPGSAPFADAKPSSAKIYKITREGDVQVVFGMPPQAPSAQSQFPHPEGISPQAVDSDMIASIISSMPPPITGPISFPPAPIIPPKTIAETEVPVRFLALAIDKDDNIYAGSGDKGILYKITPEGEIVTLCDSESHEVLSILPFNKELYFGTGNPGGIHKLLTGYALSGTYTSSVHDGQFLSAWGKVEWDADLPDKTSITVQTRTGNTDEPGELWSDWSEEYNDPKGSNITSPGARFIQFRTNLRTQDGNWTPLLREVRLIYLTKNQPPSLSKPEPDGKVTEGPQQPEGKAVPDNLQGPRRYVLSKERNITWSATDPNNDTLIYDLYYKNIKDEKWKELEEDVETIPYSIDTVKFPDGVYLIKVAASDRPSNIQANALQVEKISEELIIDNTPPQVMFKDEEPSKEGRVNINGAALDNMSIIIKGEYCLNNEKWLTFLPDDGIFDSKSEKFSIILKKVEEGENTVSVKVMDEAGNTGVSSITFKKEER